MVELQSIETTRDDRVLLNHTYAMQLGVGSTDAVSVIGIPTVHYWFDKRKGDEQA